MASRHKSSWAYVYNLKNNPVWANRLNSSENREGLEITWVAKENRVSITVLEILRAVTAKCFSNQMNVFLLICLPSAPHPFQRTHCIEVMTPVPASSYRSYRWYRMGTGQAKQRHLRQCSFCVVSQTSLTEQRAPSTIIGSWIPLSGIPGRQLQQVPQSQNGFSICKH